jgi:hypothetical protein
MLCAVWATQSGCSEDACANDRRKIEGCNRVFSRDVCETPTDRCRTSCWARVKCDQWFAVDDTGQVPPAVGRCLAKCVETWTCDDRAAIRDWWRCDGAEDCADGSDEGGRCDYFRCADGQAVRESAGCDDYSDCADGSDEENCK